MKRWTISCPSLNGSFQFQKPNQRRGMIQTRVCSHCIWHLTPAQWMIRCEYRRWGFFVRDTVRGCVPSSNVLVTTLIWLLARSFPLKEELSWSTDTMREPECFFLISTSVVCTQRKTWESQRRRLTRMNTRLRRRCFLRRPTASCTPYLSNYF